MILPIHYIASHPTSDIHANNYLKWTQNFGHRNLIIFIHQFLQILEFPTFLSLYPFLDLSWHQAWLAHELQLPLFVLLSFSYPPLSQQQQSLSAFSVPCVLFQVTAYITLLYIPQANKNNSFLYIMMFILVEPQELTKARQSTKA